jgi:hypothetical protein
MRRMRRSADLGTGRTRDVQNARALASVEPRDRVAPATYRHAAEVLFALLKPRGFPQALDAREEAR